MKDLWNENKIWSFLAENNIQIYVGFRGDDYCGYKWYCTFDHIFTKESASIRDGYVLLGKYGNGNSPQEAFEDCFMAYAGKKAFFGRYKDGKEVEVQFPIIFEA